MRDLISDTATLMFLERGFDEVRVSEIAAACDVSEKTIYNYFPTKESLVLDREETLAEDIRRALGPGTPQVSPVEAVIEILTDEMNRLVTYLKTAKHVSLQQISRFNDLIESTPALKAARADLTDRLAQVAAESLAARVGVDPSDPEPQIAADALMGLWRIYLRAFVKWSSGSLSPTEVRDAVLSDVRRAARLIDTGLWSFATVMQDKGRSQVKSAANASNEARKQVVLAMKQAREAWRVIKAEAETRKRDDVGARSRGRDVGRSTRAVVREQARREADEIRRQARREVDEIRRKVQRQREEVKATVKRAQKAPRSG